MVGEGGRMEANRKLTAGMKAGDGGLLEVRGLQGFFVKGQVVDILDFAGQAVSLVATELSSACVAGKPPQTPQNPGPRQWASVTIQTAEASFHPHVVLCQPLC